MISFLTQSNHYDMISIIFIQLTAYGVIGRKVVVVNLVVEAVLLMKEAKMLLKNMEEHVKESRQKWKTAMKINAHVTS